MASCECQRAHQVRRVVLTGGPGAGKTAFLELVRQSFCSHVKVLSEAASVIFGGGFPRDEEVACRRAAQRAIYFVQRELETIADAHSPAIVLCDRGTLDGLAYWPGDVGDFWSSVHTTVEDELARYDAVIHLSTPGSEHGYNHQNPLRTESAADAGEIDRRIAAVWSGHRRRFMVPSTSDFLDKAASALAILRNELPDCCRRHEVPTIDHRVGNAERVPLVTTGARPDSTRGSSC